MKTKTGQLLMKQIKAKNNNPISNSPLQERKITPIQQKAFTSSKVNMLLQSLPQDQVKNKQGQQQLHNHQQLNDYEDQNKALKYQNHKLSQEILRLQNELQDSSRKIHTLQQNQSLAKQLSQKVEILQKAQRQTLSQNKIQTLTNPLKSESKLQEKCSALQVQNYRLIETNYILLLNLKKNLKFFKDSLVRIVKKIEGLQFAEATKEIYDILGKIKNQQFSSEELQQQFLPYKKQEPKTAQKIEQTVIKKVEKKAKLALNSSLYNLKHFIEQRLQQRQNNIQIQLKKLPNISNEIPIYPKQSSSFHLINTRNADTDFFPQSNKLFNSQIHQNDYQISGLDQVSLQDKIESQWEGGTTGKKQPTIYKCHGNSTELYKMLMLQALTIEDFF